MVGGYIGLGIDEYGNFLNGSNPATGYNGDNTASGYGYQWGRIGLRGAGSVAWRALNGSYPLLYPSSLTAGQRGERRAENLQNRPDLGFLEQYLGQCDDPAGRTVAAPSHYPAIPGAVNVLPSTRDRQRSCGHAKRCGTDRL